MASLLLGDLNDHIKPSQACIKPVEESLPAPESQEIVTINLVDCLACKGCITSAETVLVAQQTYSQLLDALDSPQKYKQVVVSVNRNSLMAIAVNFKLDLQSCWGKLCYFLKTVLGVHRVLDVDQVGSLTLTEMSKEFVDYHKARLRGEKEGPLIVSTCPGWVCYAEKRYGDLLIPLMSKTRSPQQMTGVLVKHFYPSVEETSLGLEEIFHGTVMPCFDKKLEASREDFMTDVMTSSGVIGVRDVDTVITTVELLQIIKERCQIPFCDLPMLENDQEEPLYRHAGSSSGGYLPYVLSETVSALYPKVNGKIVSFQGRNPDHMESHFIDQDTGEVLLRFASIYGFKNIQTFVIKEKQQKHQHLQQEEGLESNKKPVRYDFVEIMACPSGCINGGGQPKPAGAETEGGSTAINRSLAKAQLVELETLYQSIPIRPLNARLVSEVYNWVNAVPDTRSKLLRTQYRAVQETTSLRRTINVQW